MNFFKRGLYRAIVINSLCISAFVLCSFSVLSRQTYPIEDKQFAILPTGLSSLSASNSSSFLSFSPMEQNYPDADATLITYISDGFKQHALQLTPQQTPKAKAPANGWPLVLFLHGYHPTPKNYGILSDGKTHRPGAYYMNFPVTYAAKGFMVIVPDYRGHNTSQGNEFTLLPNAQLWYLRDVINLFHSLSAIEGIDTDRIYLVGHSMGASIALMATVLLQDKISATSLWSLASPVNKNSNQGLTWRDTLPQIAKQASLSVPVILHHGLNDKVTPIANTYSAIEWLKLANSQYQLAEYDTNKHLFESRNFNLAISRDCEFFADKN
jgi:uncharacterized protein